MNAVRGRAFLNTDRALYLQLKDILVEQIESGELKPGEAIPGERTLAEMYDISRVTVRKCISNMAEEGYLIRSQGKETRVAHRKLNHRLGLLTGIAEEILETEEAVTIQEIHTGYRPATAQIRDALNLNEGDEVFEFDRLVIADGPLVYNRSFVPTEIGRILEGLNFNTARVFLHLERCGFHLSFAEQKMTAGLCREREAEILGCEEGSAVLVVKRTTYLETGQPILYERSVYRGDKYQYSIKLYRKLQER